jgi:type IV secretory pathway VirB2 component (pilin)
MKLELKQAVRRVHACAASKKRFVKSCLPLALFMAVSAVRCYAGTSPMAKWLTDLSAEATGTWAITAAVIGLATGLIGMKFGGHEAKGKMVTLSIIAFLLLSVQGIVTYLQGE